MSLFRTIVLLLLFVMPMVGCQSTTETDGEPQADSSKEVAPPELEAESPKEVTPASIDLTNLVDLERDSVHGEWTVSNGVLNVANSGRNSTGNLILQIPFNLPSEYDLIFNVERYEGRFGFIFTPLFHGSPVAVYIDGAKGSGIHSIDGQNYDQNPSSFKGQLFRNGIQSKIECEVRKESIRVHCDGKLIIDWEGKPSQLTLPSEYNHPDNNLLAVGAHNSAYRIHEMTLIDRTELPR